MTTAAVELLAAVLKLPPEDQEELAEELWDALDSPDPDLARLSDEEYEAEVEKLADELGLEPGVDLTWEQVRGLR